MACKNSAPDTCPTGQRLAVNGRIIPSSDFFVNSAGVLFGRRPNNKHAYAVLQQPGAFALNGFAYAPFSSFFHDGAGGAGVKTCVSCGETTPPDTTLSVDGAIQADLQGLLGGATSYIIPSGEGSAAQIAGQPAQEGNSNILLLSGLAVLFVGGGYWLYKRPKGKPKGKGKPSTKRKGK